MESKWGKPHPRKNNMSMNTAKERRILAAIEDPREKRDSCGLHCLVFTPNMHRLTDEQRDQAEADLRHQFCLWWDTGIAPQLSAIAGTCRNHSPKSLPHNIER